MEDKKDTIDDFETEHDHNCSYKTIAGTKYGGITFFTAREISRAHQKLGSNKTRKVALCDPEYMMRIIKKKIYSEKYSTLDGEVYIHLDEDDFKNSDASKMKKHFSFPLRLPYFQIKEQIYYGDNKEKIDKEIDEKINEIIRKNKDYFYYETGDIIGENEDEEDKINGKKIISTARKKESKKKDNNNLIINNNHNDKKESKKEDNNINQNKENSLNDEKKEENNNEIKSNNSLDKNENNNLINENFDINNNINNNIITNNNLIINNNIQNNNNNESIGFSNIINQGNNKSNISNVKKEDEEIKKDNDNTDNINNIINKSIDFNNNNNLNGKKTENNDTKYNKSNTSHNDDLKDKTVQQQPYYQQVWNKLFGKCCPVSLNSITENAERTIN